MASSMFFLAAQFDGRVTLTLDEACEAIGIAKKTGYNLISLGTFPIPHRKQGKRLVIDVRDVADYLDRERANAQAAFDRPPDVGGNGKCAARQLRAAGTVSAQSTSAIRRPPCAIRNPLNFWKIFSKLSRSYRTSAAIPRWTTSTTSAPTPGVRRSY
ncbi:helix-turn-helix transcriptional regulator [Paraburkholderia sp. 35.1]|uniref:helix-turn-helix transcriptional regulator n=1 Tax=Paraburkholderia sp. 35.1 TaxID=2991058 RepID=UPI003D212A6A